MTSVVDAVVCFVSAAALLKDNKVPVRGGRVRAVDHRHSVARTQPLRSPADNNESCLYQRFARSSAAEGEHIRKVRFVSRQLRCFPPCRDLNILLHPATLMELRSRRGKAIFFSCLDTT